MTTQNRQYVEMGGANFSVYFNNTLAGKVKYKCGHKDYGETFVIGEIVNSDTMVPVSNISALFQKVIEKFKKDRCMSALNVRVLPYLQNLKKMDSVLANYYHNHPPRSTRQNPCRHRLAGFPFTYSQIISAVLVFILQRRKA